jgi:hypothetical protein
MAADDQMAPGWGRIPAGAADAFDEWMARFAELDDAAVDDLLRGETPTGHDDLAPVAELAAAVRARATAHGPEIGPALRSQIQERPHVPPRFAATARRRLRLVTAAAAALMIVGVAATQNALPAAAQRFVADAAELVGLDVPRPEGSGGGVPADAGSSSGSTHTTEATEATEPSVAEGGAPSDTPGEGPSSTGGSPPEETPGGATPADPGTPGDGEPATPATPPAHSNGGGNGNNAGGNPDNNGKGDGTGGGRDTAPGQTGGQGAGQQQD